WIARALEKRELDRSERIHRRDLIDDEDRAAGPRDADELGHQKLRPRRVVRRPERPGEVEGRALDRQPLAILDDDLDVRGSVGPRASGERLVELDGDDLAHTLGE